MKFGIKLLALALLSLTMGIACASPLLVTELNIKPYINYVQGQTVEFNINVVYANFTLQNADKPVEKDSGPTISYFVIVNITNPSNLGATLTRVYFSAAPEMAYVPSFQNGSVTYDALGAWVDGKWYNLTWVNGASPSFDENGKLIQSPFKLAESYWMEGVQVFDKYVNGNLTSSYLNMNGTWTNVTGHIDFARQPLGGGYSSADTTLVVDSTQVFSNAPDENYSANGVISDGPPSFGPTSLTNHFVGQGFFSNFWEPRQSRLVALYGSWDVLASLGAKDKPVKAVQSGNLTFMTQTSNFVELSAPVNNTVINTSSDDIELKQVQLTQNGNSFIYNPLSLSSNAFQLDKWGLEVKLRSDLP